MTINDADQEHGLFSLLGTLNLTLGTVREELERSRKASMLAKATEQPRYIRFHATVTLSAAGFGVLVPDNPGPDAGYIWQVRQLAVGGLTPTTTTAGRADVFVSAEDFRQVTSLAQIGLQAWRDQATTLPLVGPYGKGELVLQQQEHLSVIVSGGTNGQQVVLVGTAEQFQEASAIRDWGM